jgi:hypothetical protein
MVLTAFTGAGCALTTPRKHFSASGAEKRCSDTSLQRGIVNHGVGHAQVNGNYPV